MRKFFVLTLKEIRELLTPQMVLPLVISVFIFMFIGQVVGEQAKSINKEKPRVAFIDNDSSQLSLLVKKGLKQQNFKVVEYKATVSSVIEKERKMGGGFLVVVPDDFSENISAGKEGVVRIYIFLPSFSYAGVEKASKIKAVISGINEVLAGNLIANATKVSPEKIGFFKNPVRFVEYVQINNRQAKGSAEAILAFVSNQSAFIPIIMTIVIIFSSQSVATAIAAEKENKTLETLLASPVSRSSIALSKMVASGLIALMAALFYLLGFRYYMNSLMRTDVPAQINIHLSKMAEQLGLKLGFYDYVLLGLTIFCSVMVALALSIILGSFAESVKSLQAVITPLMVLVLIPYLLTLFVDVTMLPSWARYLLFAIPFTHTLQAIQNLFFSKYNAVIYGIVYQAALFLLLLYVVRNIFHSDRILTTKIKLFKGR